MEKKEEKGMCKHISTYHMQQSTVTLKYEYDNEGIVKTKNKIVLKSLSYDDRKERRKMHSFMRCFRF